MQRCVSTLIDRDWHDVQAYVLDATTLPSWSFFTSATPEGDHWRVTSADGGASLRFVSPHEPGVLDHVVVTDDGHHVVVPMRVASHNGGGSELSLVVDAPADRLEADVATVTADLARLKALLEA